MTRVTMCYGLTEDNGESEFPLTADHFDQLIGISRDIGFTSIDYDNLDAWRNENEDLPEHPVTFDFDHSEKSMRHSVHEILDRHGFSENLFINTGWFDPEGDNFHRCMTRDGVRELLDLRWHIGAHTVTHPNLSELTADDLAMGTRDLRRHPECRTRDHSQRLCIYRHQLEQRSRKAGVGSISRRTILVCGNALSG